MACVQVREEVEQAGKLRNLNKRGVKRALQVCVPASYRLGHFRILS